MSFKTDRVRIVDALESFELRGPIDVPDIHRRPDDFACRVLHRVLHMAVMDAIFGQRIPAARVGIQLATHHRIAGIPVERKILRWNACESCTGLTTGSRVAGILVLKDQEYVLFRAEFRSLLQLFVDGCTVWFHVVDTPEIKAANLVGFELLGEGDRPLQNVLLLFEGCLARSMQVFFRAVL